MSARRTGRTVIGRIARVAGLAFAALLSMAHVGTNDAYFDGPAGPYAVRVAVRMPGVIPGQAQIHVRVVRGDVRRVLVQVAQWSVGKKGAPSPDVAAPVDGAPGTFAAPLWLMTTGSYAVNVTVEGAQGTATVTVPVSAVATQRLEMNRALGWGLVVLGAALIAGLLTLVRAGLREAVVAPGETPDRERRTTARVGLGVASAVVALALFGGNTWWNSVDRGYRRTLYRVPDSRAEVRAASGGAPAVVRLVLTDSIFFGKRTTPLMPDHGKLMHMFVVGVPGHDVLAHLHPTRLDSATFEAALPALPAGRYRVFADVVHESGLTRTLVTPLDVAAASAAAPIPPGGASAGDEAWFAGPGAMAVAPLGGGYTLTRDDTTAVAAGRETSLRFTVRDSAGRVPELMPYMGMAAHAIVLRADESVFVHLHPMGTISMAAQQRLLRREAGDTAQHGASQPVDSMAMAHDRGVTYPGTVSFPFAFPSPGRYRVWVQLKPAGDVRTAAFDVDVR